MLEHQVDLSTATQQQHELAMVAQALIQTPSQIGNLPGKEGRLTEWAAPMGVAFQPRTPDLQNPEEGLEPDDLVD